jgi:hypothetical protein
LPELLEAVIDSAEPAALWVADPNPRAQAFYRKHGFIADGTAQVEDGVREIRMVRGVQHDETGRPTGDCRKRNGLMACMILPWAPVATLINWLPLAGSGPSRRLQNRCSARPAGMRDHGSSGTGGPRTSRTAAAPARGL